MNKIPSTNGRGAVKKLKIPDSHKQLLLDINSQFNTKVLLSSFYYERKRELEIIQKELDLWQKVSDGEAKLPKILDLNRMKAELEDFIGIQYLDNDIWLKGSGFNGFRFALRHELMHMNDLNRYKENFNRVKDKELAELVNYLMPSKTIVENGLRKKVLNHKKCPYKKEFLKAGISPYYIKYAYTNRQEFIAVAAEGDMKRYSLEFKEILVKLGMPEFVFELPCLDKTTKSMANKMASTINIKDYNKLLDEQE
jgi:hypothetical protein